MPHFHYYSNNKHIIQRAKRIIEEYDWIQSSTLNELESVMSVAYDSFIS